MLTLLLLRRGGKILRDFHPFISPCCVYLEKIGQAFPSHLPRFDRSLSLKVEYYLAHFHRIFVRNSLSLLYLFPLILPNYHYFINPLIRIRFFRLLIFFISSLSLSRLKIERFRFNDSEIFADT